MRPTPFLFPPSGTACETAPSPRFLLRPKHTRFSKQTGLHVIVYQAHDGREHLYTQLQYTLLRDKDSSHMVNRECTQTKEHLFT